MDRALAACSHFLAAVFGAQNVAPRAGRVRAIALQRVLGAVCCLALVPAASAISLSSVNDFESGTTQSWGNGGPAPDPQNISTGGPAGLNDNFLKITSDGSGSAGKLTSFNRDAAWLGNYLLSGVTAIRMDLQNLGTVSLSIRIAFKGTTSQGAPGYSSTTAFTLPADGLWYTATFPVNASSMTGVNSPSAFNTFMTNPAEFRILHATSPSLTGTNVTSVLGVDNITAIPEPGVIALGIFGGVLVGVRRSRASRVATRGRTI